MDHNLLILTLKSLAQWAVSTRWSTKSPKLYDRAVIVDLLKSLTIDGNEFEEAQQIFVQCYLAVIRDRLGPSLNPGFISINLADTSSSILSFHKTAGWLFDEDKSEVSPPNHNNECLSRCTHKFDDYPHV